MKHLVVQVIQELLRIKIGQNVWKLFLTTSIDHVYKPLQVLNALKNRAVKAH